MSDARSKLLNFALTHSIDKEKNKDEKKEPLEDEERNEYVEAFLQMLLPREFFDLKISNGALNRMSTLTHHFAVSLVEESIRIMESENKKEIDDRDVKKATFSVLAPVETPLQSSNTFSRYFESVDAKLKEFEGLLNRRKGLFLFNLHWTLSKFFFIKQKNGSSLKKKEMLKLCNLIIHKTLK